MEMIKRLSRRTDSFSVLAIVGLAWAVYYPVIFGQFVGDDFAQIVNNAFIRSWANFPRLFSGSYTSSLYEVYHSSVVSGSGELTYRPMTTLSFMLDYFLWGLEPSGFHLTNLFVHSLNGVLMFFLSFRVLKSRAAALLSALFFVIHPVNAEAVGIISYRSTLLGAAFFMGAFIFYLESRRLSSGRLRWASAALFLFALLSKENTIAFLLLIVIYDIFFDAENAPPKKITAILKQYAPFLAVAFLFIMAWFGSKKQMGDSFVLYPGHGLPSHLIALSSAMVAYIMDLFFPFRIHLTLEDSWSRVFPGFGFYGVYPVILIGAIAATACFARRKFKMASFCCFWFLTALIPFIPCLLLRSPRYLYIPAFAFFWLFSMTAVKILKTPGLFKGFKVAVIVLIASMFWACAALDLVRISVTNHQESCVDEMLGRYPDNVQALILKASADSAMRRWDRVIAAMIRARGLEPPVYRETYVMLGISYYNQGMLNESEAMLKHAWDLDPLAATPYVWLGSIEGVRGRFERAEKYFQKALELDPRDANACFGLGVTYLKMHRVEDAKKALKRAQEINSPDPLIAQKLKALQEAVRQPESIKKS